MIKVLHQNRPKNIWQGGDWVQMENTMVALGKLGVDVSVNEQPLISPALILSTFDIVHLWNFSMEWTKWQIWAAARQHRKIVCSMIYHETEAFIPYEHQQIMLDTCDACIFLSQGEVERVRRHLKIDDSKIHIIENGIDEWWFEPTTKKNNYGKYILTVGRIETSKGQLAVAKACKELGIRYLCAGQVIEHAYAEEVIKAGGELLGPMNKEQLKPLYKHAKSVILASQHEIYPLTIMEAGSQGTNVILTETSEWKDIPNVELCKWNDVESIKQAIEKSLLKKKNLEFKNKLKKMSWANVAKSILEIYKQIL